MRGTNIKKPTSLSDLLKPAKGSSMNPTMTPEETTDRLAIRELIDAYDHCADRRDASGQMAFYTEDTAFHVFTESRSSEPTYILTIKGDVVTRYVIV
jgi:hypothetical protein